MRKLLCALLSVLVVMSNSFAQSRTLTGRITDATGAPVANASILVKGTTIGTTTNDNGSFSLSVPETAKVLVFSAVGYESIEQRIGSSNVFNIAFTSLDQKLQEVVVVAYGTQKKPEITGAINTIKGDEVANRPFTSVDRALQGAIPGLQSVQGSGNPGSIQQIRIRGIGSINASAAPLWVIDGNPINTGDLSRLTTSSNALNSLNPNDIESISVLKDASAASIYGSRAANGVILVTTKKGKAGKTKFNVDLEAGTSDIAYQNEKYKPLNASQFFDLTREGLINFGIAPASVDGVMTSNFGFGNGVDFNWLENVTRKADQQQVNLSASGGNDRTSFFVSGGYFRQEGLTVQSDFKRYTGNATITNKATEKLKFTLNTSAAYINQKAPLNGGSFGNPILSSYFLLPSRAARKEDGSLNITAPDFGPGALHNTIATAELDKRNLNQFSLRSNLTAEYQILKNLKFTSRGGIDYNILEEDQYNNPFHGDGFNVNGRAFSRYTRYSNLSLTNYLDYKQNLNKDEDFYLDFKLGYEAQKSKGYFTNVQSQGFPPTSDLIVASVGATPIAAQQDATDYAFNSVFSVLNVNYKDRYVLSASGRRDGSSRFGPNNRFGNFWSLGFSWNLDQETFMKNVEFISQLKLRASYGVNGNAGIQNYEWRPTYGFGVNYNQLPGSAPNNPGNLNLTWELNKPLNIGLDFGVFNNRISGSADYYIRKTSDLLLLEPTSLTTGFGGVSKNIGAMENKGVELTLNAIPVQTRNFNWNVNFNFATNKNKITALVNNADIVVGSFIRRVGYDFQTFYVRQYAGVDPANGDPLWYVDDTKRETTNNWNTALRTADYGSATPKIFGALTNTFTFKGISLEAQFYYNFGNYVRDSWGGFYMGSGNGGAFNKVVRQLDRWQQPGDVTDVPKYVYNGNRLAQNFSTFYLAKGDFIRLRNIQLGYTIPKSVTDRLKMNSIFFYARGTNLWTWVKDDNMPFDPEAGVSSETNLEVFIPKTITVGLNIGF